MRFFHSELELNDFTLGTALTELEREQREALCFFCKKINPEIAIDWTWCVNDLVDNLSGCDTKKAEEELHQGEERRKEQANKHVVTKQLAHQESDPPDCTFCRIALGLQHSHKVWENDAIVCFLDIAPLSKGHMLVIPRRHVEKLHELDENEGKELGAALVKIAKALDSDVDYNVLSNNGAQAFQSVFHLHFHIIPKTGATDGLRLGLWKTRAQVDLGMIAKELNARLSK